MHSGQAKLIKQLIHERGAEVDKRDKDGWTPLLYAALTYERAISGVWRRGTDLNLCSGKTNAALALIDEGADINARESTGNFTALHLCAQ